MKKIGHVRAHVREQWDRASSLLCDCVCVCVCVSILFVFLFVVLDFGV